MLTSTAVVSSYLPVLENRPLSLDGTGMTPSLANANIADAAEDAAKVELTTKDGEAENGEEAIPGSESGVLFNALKAAGQIAQALKHAQEQLALAAPGSEKAAVLQNEIANLGLSYQAALNNDTVRRGLETLGAVQNSLMAGASTDAVTKGLDRSLLGSSLTGLIRNASFDKLTSIASSLNELAMINPAETVSADLIASRVADTLKQFSGAGPQVEASAEDAPEGEMRVITAPRIKRLTFDESAELSVGLRTLGTTDMIKAAAAHMDLDLERSLILLKGDGGERPDRKLTPAEEEKRRENTAKLGVFYGENQPQAMLGELSTDEKVIFNDGAAEIVPES